MFRSSNTNASGLTTSFMPRCRPTEAGGVMSRPSIAAVIGSVVAGAMLSAGVARIAAQGPPPPPKNPPPPGWIDPRNPPKEDPKWQPSRTPDGQPNIQGQWNQASDIITYSIEDPEADRAEHIAISGQRAMVGRPIIARWPL